MIACSNCGTENEPGRKFCVECGTRLAVACSVCGTVNPVDAKFCGECGNQLAGGPGSGTIAGQVGGDSGRGAPSGDAAAFGSQPIAFGAQAASQSAQPTAERRLVTVMFVDLVGFTTASEGRDAEDTRELLSTYYETAREIVRRHGGVIEKFIGDAVMAVWGSPTAHEDDAERAVRTALELVTAVPRLAPVGQTLQARAGVLTGEAAVSIGAEGEGMVAGDLVNTASRVQSVAEPGSVLVGESTYHAASMAISFDEAGERALKGKELPIKVWRAVAVVARRGGGGRSAILEPPFVGRDDDLRLLKDLFHATAREGKPRLVTVAGQAGIGKSRLVWELEKYLDGVVDRVLWHEGRSPSYGEGISYWALAEMIRGRSGIAETDDPVTARERVRAMLIEFVADEADRRWIEPRVMGLLGIDELPSESRDELFAAWRTLFERIAARAPLLLAFWDLQWADQGMLDFIDHLLGSARSSPIFVLAEARPELFDRRPGWGTGVRSATLVHLEPLEEGAMRQLLLGLVPNLPAHGLRRIVERAEGVPLYAVETLRMLLDRGVIQPDGQGFALAGDLPTLAVPETLHALIAARLDALPPDDRALIADGSVLGLSFTLPGIVALTDLKPEIVPDHLDNLVRHELLILDVDPRSPERGQYRFVQGVVREVAYQSIARRTRQAKHLAAARYFESLAEGDISGVLATHYLSAYRAASAGPGADVLAAQARVALRAAADRALALHDLLGALTYLEEALEVTTDPAEQASLHERAAPVASEAARTQEALDHAERAVAIYTSLGDRLGVLRSRAGVAFVRLAEHADRTAIALLEEVLSESADLGPTAEAAHAQSELARALMLAGSPDAVTWADRVLEHPSVVSPTVVLETLITKGTALAREGREIEGEAILRGAIAIADAEGNLFASLRSRNNLRVQIELSDLRGAFALTGEVHDLAVKYGQRTWVLHALGASLDDAFRLGYWDAFVDEALAEIPDASGFYATWYRTEQAHRLAFRGSPELAERILDEALTTEGTRASAQATTWIIASKSDALTAQGRFREAFELAQTGWGSASSEARFAIMASLFAAAAEGDVAKLPLVLEARRKASADRLPMTIAFDHMVACLEALLTGRWVACRTEHLAASRILDEVGEATNLARLQLAVGHLAAGRFREADEAATAAEAFFHERGADAFVATYRASAAAPAAPEGAEVLPAPHRAVRAVR